MRLKWRKSFFIYCNRIVYFFFLEKYKKVSVFNLTEESRQISTIYIEQLDSYSTSAFVHYAFMYVKQACVKKCVLSS